MKLLKTREALAAYAEEQEGSVKAAFNTARNDDDVVRAVWCDDWCGAIVGQAFAIDTADVNGDPFAPNNAAKLTRPGQWLDAALARDGPLTSWEFNTSAGYTTGVGALARAAHWRLAMRDQFLPRSWCLAAHAACIADARRLAGVR